MNSKALKVRAAKRAARALAKSGLRKQDSTIEGIRKLDKAMSKEFGPRLDVKTRPMGITLAELPVKPSKSMEITGSGTVKCTFTPWECSPDVDF